MKSFAPLVAFMIAAGGGPAAAANFEYDNPSPFYPGLQAQPNLGQIHLTKSLHDSVKAYIAYPSSTTKVVVAILDGYADRRHVDLSGRLTNVLVYSGRYRRYDNHGTHVSGIVGATQNSTGIVGVDPFATLVNIPVFDDRGWVANDLGKKALDKAASLGARVANMSYGPTTPGDMFLTGELNLFRNYNSSTAGKGIVLVRAGGNDGVYSMNEAYSGNAAIDLSHLLIVGSVNSNNVLSYFSNAPGNACIGGAKSVCTSADANAMMNFWLVAPGENIMSDLPNNYVGLMSGTSMAAPHVAGAAALVYQKALAGNTKLTPGQVAQILKLSADDLGSPGVDTIYGWGLLDVAAALNPVGSTYFPTGATVNSGLVVTSNGKLVKSSMVKTGSLEGALSGVMIVDDFKRAFVVGEPHVFSEAPVPRTNFLEDFMGGLSAETTSFQLADHSTLSVTSSQSASGMRMVSFDGSNLHYDMGLDASASYFTSAGGGLASHAEPFSRVMVREFYDGSGDAAAAFDRAMVLGWDLKTSSRLTLSGLYLRTAPFGEPDMPGYVATRVLAQDRPISSLLKLGANYRVTNAASAGIYAGYLGEDGHTLGMQTGGAFSLGDGATYITGVNINAALAAKTKIAAFAEQSTTVNDGVRNSLFAADQWSGSKYGASLTQSDPFGAGGLVRLKLVRSWQIDDGSLNIHVPVGRELDGSVNYDTRVISVAGDETPLELGLAYLGGGSTLNYGAEVRMLEDTAPSRVDDAQLSLATGMRWRF